MQRGEVNLAVIRLTLDKAWNRFNETKRKGKKEKTRKKYKIRKIPPYISIGTKHASIMKGEGKSSLAKINRQEA